jgi:hypothetical protein
MSTEEKDVEAAERTKITRLAERGDAAVKRLTAEFEKHERLTDARSRLEGVEKSVLTALNIASVAEVEELRKAVIGLDERLAKLEGGSSAGTKKAEPGG